MRWWLHATTLLFWGVSKQGLQLIMWQAKGLTFGINTVPAYNQLIAVLIVAYTVNLLACCPNTISKEVGVSLKLR
jgi:hypothetical protein